MTAERPTFRPLDAFPVRASVQTRWDDNDIYGHVNNVVYYSYFDTVVNRHLIEAEALDIHDGEVIGLVVETGCRYRAPLAFPEPVTAGMGVAHIGRSSVRYEIGLYGADQTQAAAEGFFIHVYVDRTTRRPTELPARFREVLEAARF